MADLTAIILTYNEEQNIEDCLRSIKKVASRIIVIDSFSVDRTKEICMQYGVEFYEHPFENHSKQFNYGLENMNITTKWVLRIDADERLTEESSEEIEKFCEAHSDDDINGLVLRFKFYFLGKYLKHGGCYPFLKLCVFKFGKAYIEDKEMDEHTVLTEGRSIKAKKDCLRHDFKSVSSWIDKHNKYSTRELKDYNNMQKANSQVENLDLDSKRKNRVKNSLYYKLPLGFRAKLYYLYRYYLKFGFLDGKPGKFYAFLQAYWYRYLVDAKIYEQEIREKKK
jgi:glycosyltransferase involved in cell wall biosynthesis